MFDLSDGSDVCARDMYVSTENTGNLGIRIVSSSDTNLKTPPSSKATTTTPTHENNETSLQWYSQHQEQHQIRSVLKPVMPDGRGDELSLVILKEKKRRSEEENRLTSTASTR